MSPIDATRRKPSALWYVGMPVMILGIVSATIFSMRQYKESGSGHTYYEFIIPGVVLLVTGLVLMMFSRQRPARGPQQPPPSPRP